MLSADPQCAAILTALPWVNSASLAEGHSSCILHQHADSIQILHHYCTAQPSKHLSTIQIAHLQKCSCRAFANCWVQRGLTAGDYAPLVCTTLPGIFVQWQANIQTTKGSVDFPGEHIVSVNKVRFRNFGPKPNGKLGYKHPNGAVGRAWLFSGLLGTV